MRTTAYVLVTTGRGYRFVAAVGAGGVVADTGQVDGVSVQPPLYGLVRKRQLAAIAVTIANIVQVVPLRQPA